MKQTAAGSELSTEGSRKKNAVKKRDVHMIRRAPRQCHRRQKCKDKLTVRQKISLCERRDGGRVGDREGGREVKRGVEREPLTQRLQPNTHGNPHPPQE